MQPSSNPTLQPTLHPTGQPSSRPLTSQPSTQPTRCPTQQPSVQPSRHPSQQPTARPNWQPTNQPSQHPTRQPSVQPCRQPTLHPTMQPSSHPSLPPSQQPSMQPSSQPTEAPSTQPSRQPSDQPSAQPLSLPSSYPTMQPTMSPSCQPSRKPLKRPLTQPTSQPSGQPRHHTQSPSMKPGGQSTTTQPLQNPSTQPSQHPTSQPSIYPSKQPNIHPSSQSAAPLLTMQPTGQPSEQPFARPTSQSSTSRHPVQQLSLQPSCRPTILPSECSSTTQPTCQPSATPSRQPTSLPSIRPSIQPTTQLSIQPSSQPSCSPSESLLNRRFFNGSLSLHVEVSPNFKIVLPFLFVNPVNGDGFEDIVVYNEATETASKLVALGGRSEVRLFEIHTSIFCGYSSRSVSIAGDVNGDGRDDIIIGVPYASRCYVLYGTKLGFINMTEGFTVYGADPSDLTGWSVSGAGDINNDTYADLIIVAPSAVNSDGVLSGVVYILYGGKGLEDFDLKHLNETWGFKLHSSMTQDAFGLSVSRAGDFNGDGFDDVIVGALRMAGYFSGAAYIIYGGQKMAKYTTINVDPISDNDDIVLYGTYHSWFAYSVSGAGDVNGDGFDDVLIGSTPRRATTEIQKSYLIYGTNKIRIVDISSLASTHGVVIEGGGVIVSGIGDINSDGFDDLMMGSNFALSIGSGIVIMQPKVETPTVSPSKAPGRTPAWKPTRRPSVFVTCKPSTKPTVSHRPTMYPSVRPSQPTRLPTASLSNPSSRPSSSPSQPTMWPSLEPTTEPSETPTQEDDVDTPSETPIIYPSIPPTQHPSSQSPITGVPTLRPSLSSTLLPTKLSFVRPTISPTEVVNVTYIDRVIHTGMTITRDRAVLVNYIVNTTEDVRFTHSGLVEMFTIVPNKDSTVKIDEFNVSCDIINLEYFEAKHSLQTLSMSVVDSDGVLLVRRHLRVQHIVNMSLAIKLGNNQVILLVNISQSMLNESNFIFMEPSGQHVVLSNKIQHVVLSNKIQEKFIVSIICYVVVCLIVMYLLYMACVPWLTVRRERRVMLSKFNWAEIQANNITYLSFTSLYSDSDSDNDNDVNDSINSANSSDGSDESKIDSDNGCQSENNNKQMSQPIIVQGTQPFNRSNHRSEVTLLTQNSSDSNSDDHCSSGFGSFDTNFSGFSSVSRD